MKKTLWIILLLLGASSLLKAQSDTVILANPHLGVTDVDTGNACVAPSVIVTATADTVCTGESVTLEASVSGNGVVMPMVTVGDILCTDGSFVKPSDWAASGQTALGVVFYVDSTGAHGWAVSVADQTPSVKWSSANMDVLDLTNRTSFLSTSDSISQYSGYHNTQCIRAAGIATQFPAAYTVDFDNGWYLPDIVQLNLFMSEYYFVNPTFLMLGISYNMTQSYWSSTEYSNNKAWIVNVLGTLETEYKSALHLVLSVRDF